MVRCLQQGRVSDGHHAVGQKRQVGVLPASQYERTCPARFRPQKRIARAAPHPPVATCRGDVQSISACCIAFACTAAASPWRCWARQARRSVQEQRAHAITHALCYFKKQLAAAAAAACRACAQPRSCSVRRTSSLKTCAHQQAAE